MRIDVHSHFLDLDLVRHLEGRPTRPTSYRQGGEYFIDCAPGLTHGSGPRITDMEVKLREMEVMDIDLLRARLERAQLEIQEIPPVPGISRFMMRDPDGNLIELVGPEKAWMS